MKQMSRLASNKETESCLTFLFLNRCYCMSMFPICSNIYLFVFIATQKSRWSNLTYYHMVHIAVGLEVARQKNANNFPLCASVPFVSWDSFLARDKLQRTRKACVRPHTLVA